MNGSLKVYQLVTVEIDCWRLISSIEAKAKEFDKMEEKDKEKDNDLCTF